jgi:hypothetical protein
MARVRIIPGPSVPAPPPATSRRRPVWLNAGALLLASWLVLTALTLTPRPDADVIAVVFPPWWGGDRALLTAASTGATIVRSGALPTILVVQPADGDGRARLRRAGAWLALDPQALGGCLTSTNDNN